MQKATWALHPHVLYSPSAWGTPSCLLCPAGFSLSIQRMHTAPLGLVGLSHPPWDVTAACLTSMVWCLTSLRPAAALWGHGALVLCRR